MLSPGRLLEYGPLGLFVVAFFESNVFPIPPDVLLLPLCLATPRLSWWYAFMTTSASVLGGLLGYAVGRKAGRPVVEKFVSREMVDKVQELFAKYGGWAVGIAAFTPIPFKVFTFGAGIFRVPLWTFTITSIAGRAGRFFLEAAMVFFLGDRARGYLGRNFEVATLLLTGILLVAAAFYPKIDSYLRRSELLDRIGLKDLARAARNAGARVRSLRRLGIRILAGMSASTVFLLLAVVYLEDLVGPERDALNRSLMPVYGWFVGLERYRWLWDGVRFPLIWGTLLVAGAVKYAFWHYGNRDYGNRAHGITARIAVLVGVAYGAEVSISSYVPVLWADGSLPVAGRAFLIPYYLMFGMYLLSKGMRRPAQIALLFLTAALAGGSTAYLVLTGKTDAAVATASVVMSAFLLALSYTVLAVRKPVRPSL